MEKENRPLFFRVVSIVILIFLINLLWFVYKANESTSFTTGFSIKILENSGTYISEMPLITKIFLIIQWGLLFLVLFFSVFKDYVFLNKKEDFINIESYNTNKNKTDIDLLYEILQKRKKINVSTITNTFKINKDIAFDWCKILESGNLAEIDYSGFGDPILRLKEEKNEAKFSKEESEEKAEEPKKKSFFGFLSKFLSKPRIWTNRPKGRGILRNKRFPRHPNFTIWSKPNLSNKKIEKIKIKKNFKKKKNKKSFGFFKPQIWKNRPKQGKPNLSNKR